MWRALGVGSAAGDLFAIVALFAAIAILLFVAWSGRLHDPHEGTGYP